MKLAAITDIGRCRQENQDNFCARQLTDGRAWGAVFDGMGGVNGGKVAAELATQNMLAYFAENLDNGAPEDVRECMLRSFDVTNRNVYDRATSDPTMLGMGTTAVCAYVSDGEAHVVHAGDSRCYLYRGMKLRQITRDHSMVQQLVDSGKITREQALNHPQKNLITRALGVSAHIVPEYNSFNVFPGDILLLCTDGLTNMVPDEEIRLILSETAFFDAADILMKYALKAGGQDNITVMLIGVEDKEVSHG